MRYAVDYPQQGAKLFENIITYVVYYAETLMDLESQVTAQQDQVTTLQGQVSDLQDEITTLEGEKTTLEGEKATLEGRVATLEGEVTSLKGSVGTWQGIAAATFLIGLVIGVAVIYMTKR